MCRVPITIDRVQEAIAFNKTHELVLDSCSIVSRPQKRTFGSFFLHSYIFLPAPPQFCKFRNWLPQFWDMGVCYGFINPEVNHVAFWMRGCSGSKVCINYWFSNCWIQKPNFYYGLMDPQWFFSIMNFWIRNTYFELRIGWSGMVFSIMDVLHFFILD